MRLTMALVVCSMLGAGQALAAVSPPHTTVRDTATLITDTDAIAAGAPFHAALRLQLAPGWHTYWQNPGEAGVAPEIDWALPPGASAGVVEWPVPARVAEGPVTTFAYTGDVVLPVQITATGPLTLKAHAEWLVCQQICVPEQADFAVELAAGAPAPSAQAPLFAAAAAHRPVPSPFAASFAADGSLTLQGDGLPQVRAAQFYPADSGSIDPAAEQAVQSAPGHLTLRLRPGEAFDPKKPLAGVLALTDARGGETALDVAAQPGGSPAPRSEPFGRLLLLALLGGLVLNLMPCVFPILAMKAIGLAGLSGHGRRTVRLHALSYVAGVMLAFVGIGGALVGLRAGGRLVGWGFQFQSPAAVAVMAWVLFAAGLNLSGLFAVGGGRLSGVGQGLAARGGYGGAFATGLLAVLVATPCTAPFMGVAIAAALAAPVAQTLLVFAALGLGLALPYAALAMVPAAARLLPRPGAWMDLTRQVLAFPMYGAAAWLVSVLSQEAGADGVLAAGAGLVTLGFAAWLLGRAQSGVGAARRVGTALALVAAVAPLALLPGLAVAPTPAAVADATEAFTPARLAALRAAGRPVFVNMTAAWCVSCLVNERVALSPGAVKAAFAQRGVAYLKGDWTRPDPAISAYLRDHGREGVPLYVYYPPGGEGEVLPQILTEAGVLRRVAGG